MNETSKNILKICTKINSNSFEQKNIVAYSIDAGCHVFLFYMRENGEIIRQEIIENYEISKNIESFIKTSIGKEGVEIITK